MKKFNWGHGITIFYIIFVATLATVLVASMNIEHNLVVDDYYAKDLDFQNQYEKQNNQLASKNLAISVDSKKEKVLFDFTSESDDLIGTVHFYRAADKNLDFSEKIASSNFTVNSNGLAKGKWTVKVDWTEEGIKYYKEKQIIL